MTIADFGFYTANVTAVRDTLIELFVKGLALKSPTDATQAASLPQARAIITEKNAQIMLVMKKKAYNPLKGTFTRNITDLKKCSIQPSNFKGFCIVIDKDYELNPLPDEQYSIRLLWSKMKTENSKALPLYKLISFKTKGEPLTVESNEVKEIFSGELLPDGEIESDNDNNVSDSSADEYATPMVKTGSLLSRMASKLSVPTFDVETDNIAEVTEVLTMLDELDNGKSTKLLVINFCQQNGLMGLLTNLNKNQKTSMKEFVKAVKSRYEKKQRTLNLQQKKGEDEADFLHRLERQFHQIKSDPANTPLTDESKKLIHPYFIDGLRDKTIRMLIRRDDPNYDDLAKNARKYRQCQEQEDLLPKSQSEIISMLSQQIENLRTDITNNSGSQEERTPNQSPRSPQGSQEAHRTSNEVCNYCGRFHGSGECRENGRGRANHNRRRNQSQPRRNQGYQIQGNHQFNPPHNPPRYQPRRLDFESSNFPRNYHHTPPHSPGNFRQRYWNQHSQQPRSQNRQQNPTNNEQNIANNNPNNMNRQNNQYRPNQGYQRYNDRNRRGNRRNNQRNQRNNQDYDRFIRSGPNSFLASGVETNNEPFLY